MQLASSEEELESQFAALDPLVNKLNLPQRDAPYTMAEVIAYAETGDGKGVLTDEELAKLKLASATAAQWGYSPTYTATIAPTTAGLPTDEQPANRSRSWVANVWNGIVRGLTGRNNEVHTQETDGQPSAAQPSAGQFDLGDAGSITWGEADTWYIDAWSNANRLGLSDLTDTQKIEAAALLQSWAEQGSLSTNLDAIQLETTRNAFTNLTPNAAAFMHYGQIAEDADLVYGDIVNVDENSSDYSRWVTAYGGVAEFEAAKEAAEDYFEEVADGTARVEKRWGDMTDEVLETAKQWKGTNRDIAQSMVDMNSAMLKIANNQYYRQQYLSGDRSDETVDAITGMTGKNRQMVKDGDPAVISAMEVAAASDLEAVNVYADAIEHGLNELPEELRLSLPSIYAEGGDLSAVADAVQAYDANLAEMIRQFAANVDEYGFEAALEMLEGADGQVLFDMVVSGLGATGVKPSGGGGGGGKSAVDKLLEEQEREQKLWEHRRKMIQYEETRYQNAGELSNYAIMLGHEADEIQRQIGLREKQIEQLKDQMRKTEEYSDDWYTLRDAIMSGEEALSELINDAEELDRTLEEVQQQILKLHTDLEGTVLEEIEARIQKEREMQDATVSMQETILEAIRERYRKEWELMQEDLNKKRKALEEEISLIDERLQRRKDAEDEAAKHEELAELRRQYAMISMDSSRTKDQKELAEKIRELEDELMWGEAEDEAEREKTELQEQVDAYNEYETEYQEWLDEFLEDANNFTEEVNTVLKMNQEEMLAWLSENVEAFSLSLKEAQDQMLRNWADTFKQMRGITDTYWAEIAETLSSKEGFLAYMMESDAYKNASEDEKAQMVYNWETMYDDWIAAKKIRDEAVNWDHQDDFETGTGVSSGTASTTTYYGGYNPEGVWTTGYGVTRADAEVLARNKKLTGVIYSTTGPVSKPVSGTVGSAAAHHGAGSSQFSQVALAYSSGGYVDYTGLAMVHGSPSRPEAFLSAADTELVRTMLDTWHFVAGRPTIMNVDGALGHGGTANTFGDISITITEASFADDADYEEVAKRVGEAFTKELSKQGFRTATFNF